MVRFKVEGLKELEQAMMGIKGVTAEAIARRALTEAVEPFVNEIERDAPHLTGRLGRSAGAGTKLSKRQRSLNRKQSKVEIYAGFGALPQAITEEFGTANTAPRPNVTPAWEAKKHNMLEDIRDFLSEKIEKTAARWAKRSARLKAK